MLADFDDMYGFHMFDRPAEYIEMDLIWTYVPEAEFMSLEDAWKLAQERDREAAEALLADFLED